MKIAICSSFSFVKGILEVEVELKKLGHEVFIPSRVELYADGVLKRETRQESIKNKIKYDRIRQYFNVIKNSDAILVINKDKNGIKNYIGGNSFLEMGFAHILNKKIYLLNSIPEMLYTDEIVAMQPKILDGNLDLLN